MENNTFKIYYDDQPNEVVDRISSVLKQFGLIITDITVGDADGHMKYEITIKDKYNGK